MAAKLKALWYLQDGACFYCGRDTWLRSRGERKIAARVRLGLTTNKELRRREASIEHLHRRQDGGTDAMVNLVMACVGCNADRGQKPSLIHFAEMQQTHA